MLAMKFWEEYALVDSPLAFNGPELEVKGLLQASRGSLCP